MQKRRCMLDGFPFEGEPYLVPKSYDKRTQKFEFENVVFCSNECAKGYLVRRFNIHPEQLSLFRMYVGHSVNVCPDPTFIVDYMYQPDNGMSIEEFRSNVQKEVKT